MESLIDDQIKLFLAEDCLVNNLTYLNSLPNREVKCHLKFKDDLIIAGLPWFFRVFQCLGGTDLNYSSFSEWEGKKVSRDDHTSIDFKLPFSTALSGERVALNLLQRMSSIASYTNKHVHMAGDIKILDTRKTTPGLRSFEKYAVRIGGGHNHRMTQTDIFMIKDNHKSFFGGVTEAVEYFKQLNSFYTPLVLEIHSLEELQEGYDCGVKHFLLDNFSPAEIKEAVGLKFENVTYEVSGGINLENLKNYLIPGVDAISSGSIIYNAPQVDISLKMEKI